MVPLLHPAWDTLPTSLHHPHSHFTQAACALPPAARLERYRHLGSEDDETNDEESSAEIPQFSSCSHRFSKVGPWPGCG